MLTLPWISAAADGPTKPTSDLAIPAFHELAKRARGADDRRRGAAWPSR